MTTLLTSRQLLLVVITSLWTHSTWSEDEDELEDTSFNAELSVGGEYDSNVTIDEVDLNSSQSDYALTMNAKLESHTPCRRR